MRVASLLRSVGTLVNGVPKITATPPAATGVPPLSITGSLAADGTATGTVARPGGASTSCSAVDVSWATGGQLFTVTPNSPYASGVNAVSFVLQNAAGGLAGAGARLAAVKVMDARGRRVTALWLFGSGTWTFYLPALPSVDGGLRTLPPIASALVLLE